MPKRSRVKYDPAKGVRVVCGISYGGDEGYTLAYHAAMVSKRKPKKAKKRKG